MWPEIITNSPPLSTEEWNFIFYKNTKKKFGLNSSGSNSDPASEENRLWNQIVPHNMQVAIPSGKRKWGVLPEQEFEGTWNGKYRLRHVRLILTSTMTIKTGSFLRGISSRHQIKICNQINGDGVVYHTREKGDEGTRSKKLTVPEKESIFCAVDFFFFKLHFFYIQGDPQKRVQWCDPQKRVSLLTHKKGSARFLKVIRFRPTRSVEH